MHIRSGWWVVAATFAGLILSFLGPYGPYAPYVSSYVIIPFPCDTVLATVVAIVLYVYAIKSGVFTKDLEIVLRDLGVMS